jgi:hypothetical protein
MIRRIDIARCIVTLAFAILCLPGVVRVAGAETALEPAPISAISGNLVRSIISTWAREQIEAAESEELDGSTRYEVSARWQGDILLKTPGQVEFELRRLSSRPFRGPTVVRLELYVDGQLDRAMTVTVDCRYFRDVVVHDTCGPPWQLAGVGCLRRGGARHHRPEARLVRCPRRSE